MLQAQAQGVITAHPRSRGEHKALYTPGHLAVGSSPLARGTSRLGAVDERAFRLIPARAGNIWRTSAMFSPSSAHPRSRGEHNTTGSRGFPGDGSSPLARGTWWLRGGYTARRRLIPARAGNIYGARENPYALSAHPRSRGEHVGNAKHVTGSSGSSPLARGTFALYLNQSIANRLIPARAGNILVRRESATPPAAHPRSRGEHTRVHT